MAQASLVEGWENDFCKLNENAMRETGNGGHFANDALVSPSAGRVRCGWPGGWRDDVDPLDYSGAAWQLLTNLKIDNVRTLCAQNTDGLYHIKLENGARAFFYIAKEKDKKGKISESVGFTVPNDETNPETRNAYFKFPFTTKKYDSDKKYTFDNCKDEKESLPYMVANDLLIDLIPADEKQKIGLPITKSDNQDLFSIYEQAGGDRTKAAQLVYEKIKAMLESAAGDDQKYQEALAEKNFIIKEFKVFDYKIAVNNAKIAKDLASAREELGIKE